MIRLLSRWLCFAAVLLISFALHAQEPVPPPPEPLPQRIDRISAALQKIETALQNPDLNDAALADLRTQTNPFTGELQDTIEHLNPQLAGLKTRLDQLGPKPDDKAPAESPAVTAERQDQQAAFNKTDELLKRTRLLAVQADQTLTHIATRRHLLFTRSLFQSSTSLASPSLWVAVAHESGGDLRAVHYLFTDWISGVNDRLDGWRMPAFWGVIGFIFILYWPLSRLSRRVLSREPTETQPTRFRKIAATWWVAFGIAGVPIATLFAMAMIFDAFDLTNDRLQPFMRALGDGIIRVSLAGGVARGLFAPTRPNWRFFSLTDLKCERIVALALSVTTVVSITKLSESLTDIIAASLSVSVALRGVGALIVAILTLVSLRGMAEPSPSEDCLGPIVTMTSRWIKLIRIFIWAVGIAVIIAVFSGYIALGSFIVDQLVWVSAVTAVFFMLMVLIDEFIATNMQPEARISHVLAVNLGIEQRSLNLLGVLLAGLSHAILFILAALLILAPWGLQSTDVPSGLKAAFFGVQVGDFTVSLSSVASALLIFALCYIASHAVTRWLDQKFLPQTKLDIGLRNSIKTSIGYLGFVVALLLALSYVGLNFEKLAVVAGALSVGIGFGLQAIVNNFVSGLILLWERVIRVGDWIVIGDEQGLVRRINVRATEIETFDRALIVVPNANLITGVIKNWVRMDRGGRFKIPIALTLATDPEKVRDLLLAAANAHPLVMREPKPQVYFTSISATALNFELYGFVADVSEMSGIKSDLYFAVFKRFAEAGIEIAPAAAAPIVNITGLEQLEKLLQPEASKSKTESAKPASA